MSGTARQRRRLAWPLLALALALAGCARTPAPLYYVLAPAAAPMPGTSERGGTLVGLGPIRFPDYLDRPQIVTRASTTRLVLANGRRWAEPLGHSAARLLQDRLAAELPVMRVRLHPWAPERMAIQVPIAVQRFDMGPDRVVTLIANWRIQRGEGGNPPSERTSIIAIPPGAEADPYEGLAAAHAAALAELARQIAAALDDPPGQP